MSVTQIWVPKEDIDVYEWKFTPHDSCNHRNKIQTCGERNQGDSIFFMTGGEEYTAHNIKMHLNSKHYISGWSMPGLFAAAPSLWFNVVWVVGHLVGLYSFVRALSKGS
jgi:hypothetical protein